jgi:hypothetical protein
MTAFGAMQLIKIQELNDRFANEAVDVMGIVDRVEPSAMIQTRDGREVNRSGLCPLQAYQALTIAFLRMCLLHSSAF